MILLGTGGHAKVVASILKSDLIGCFDDFSSQSSFESVSIHKYKKDIWTNSPLLIAIGDNATRKKIANSVFHVFGRVISPSAVIADSANIGVGSQIIHGVIIQAYVEIGKHTIINTGASVDHDCIVGDFCHIAPQVTLCGNVKVGEGTLIGAGSTVIPGIKIGKWCTIGAGTVVINDVPDYATVVGNPGRVLRINES